MTSESQKDVDNFLCLIFFAWHLADSIYEDRGYPAILVITGDHDDWVFPAHSYKFLPTLQEKYKGKNPKIPVGE